MKEKSTEKPSRGGLFRFFTGFFDRVIVILTKCIGDISLGLLICMKAKKCLQKPLTFDEKECIISA